MLESGLDMLVSAVGMQLVAIVLMLRGAVCVFATISCPSAYCKYLIAGIEGGSYLEWLRPDWPGLEPLPSKAIAPEVTQQSLNRRIALY